jgi:ADP-heptose:LPS heptosyltransferase
MAFLRHQIYQPQTEPPKKKNQKRKNTSKNSRNYHNKDPRRKGPRNGFPEIIPNLKNTNQNSKDTFSSEKIGIHNSTSFSPEKALLADVWAEILKYLYKSHNGSLLLILAP